MLAFRRPGEPRERPVPELLDECPQLDERLRPRFVVMTRPRPSLADEAGGLEDLQVLGNGRAADVKVPRDLARCQLTVAQEPEDVAASRFNQGLQHILHAR